MDFSSTFQKIKERTPWVVRQNKWYVLIGVTLVCFLLFALLFSGSDRKNGLQALQNENYESALDYLTVVHKYDQKDIPVIYGIAQSYQQLGESEKAIAYYSKIIEIIPESHMANMGRAQCYMDMKEYEYALNTVEYEINKGNKTIEAFYLKGRILMRMFSFREAIYFFNRVLVMDPDHIYAMYHRGICKGQVNDYSGISDLTNVIEKDKYFTQAYYNRGILLQKKFYYKKAIADFETAMDQEMEKADLHYRNGICYLRLGNKRKACKSFKNAKALEVQFEIPEFQEACL